MLPQAPLAWAAQRRAALALLLAALPMAGCARPPAPDEVARRTAPAAPAVAAPAPLPATPQEAAPDPFTATVRPILSRTCAPCHEPNGQMYAKLPFDDAAVVASHPSGVLKRLKGQDKEAVERWLSSLESPGASKPDVAH